MLLEQVNAINKSATDTEVNNPNILTSSKLASTSISERRHAEFFDVINTSLKINTPEQFSTWAKTDLQQIFPHGMLIAGIVLIQNHNAKIHHLLACNLPPAYLQTLQQNGGMGSSPVFVQWLNTRRPVLFELVRQNVKLPWLDNFRHHGLHNMAAHGQCDLNSDVTSYFSFSQIPGALNSRHTNLLELLVPHLHLALARAFKGVQTETRKTETAIPDLSEREQEILHWLSLGKTNWEIAQVLGISENTVKNHVQRILAKLNVNTRSQAVSKGLIPA